MADRRLWLAHLLLALSMALGCNDSPTPTGNGGGGGSGSGSTGTEEPVDLCMSALDPSTYGASVWLPTPLVGTTECPALNGPLVVDLQTVTIEGVVEIDGQPADVGSVRLEGRGGEGRVSTLTEDDGSFALTALSGHYDVWVIHGTDADVPRARLVVESADFVSSTSVELEVPPLATVTGLMTLDGEPAPDPTAHIFVTESTPEDPADPLRFIVARMDQGSYSIRLPPGTYDFGYTMCFPDEPTIPHTGDNPCYDPDIVLSRPFSSPQQAWVPVSTGVVIDEDMQLDLDVPTVRFSGSLELEGGPPDVSGLYIGNDAGPSGGGWIGPKEGFDARVVEGTYTLEVHNTAPIVETLVLDQDLHMDIVLDTNPLNVSFEPPPPEVDSPFASGPQVLVSTESRYGDWGFSAPDGGAVELFADHFLIELQAQYCWPDYLGELPTSRLRLYDDLWIDKPLDLVVSAPELARVEIEYADFGEPRTPGIDLFSVDDPEPGAHPFRFRPEESSFVAHGVMPAGTYRLGDEEFEVVDGMSIRVVRDSQWVEFDLRVDGQSMAVDQQLRLVGHHLPDAEGATPPGRYPIEYSGYGAAPVADNHGAVVGCVTVEG